VQQELDGADVLVNNAGVMLTAPFTSDQRDEHRRMVETNLLGAMTVTEVFLDQLRAGEGGDLVNISSVAGRVAPEGFAAYAATKWGMNGWSDALRVELQPDVHAESQKAAKEVLDWSLPPSDIADVITFAVSRPQRMTLNEILVRPPVRSRSGPDLGRYASNIRPTTGRGERAQPMQASNPLLSARLTANGRLAFSHRCSAGLPPSAVLCAQRIDATSTRTTSATANAPRGRRCV
jgi:hypothetical protein